MPEIGSLRVELHTFFIRKLRHNDFTGFSTQVLISQWFPRRQNMFKSLRLKWDQVLKNGPSKILWKPKKFLLRPFLNTFESTSGLEKRDTIQLSLISFCVFIWLQFTSSSKIFTSNGSSHLEVFCKKSNSKKTLRNSQEDTATLRLKH